MRVLLSTAPPEQAAELARALVEARLVGCCNLVPGVRSFYWWEDEVQDDAEVLMVMETTDEQLGAAMRRLDELHPYDVPKIVALEPNAANPDYLGWLARVCAQSEGVKSS